MTCSPSPSPRSLRRRGRATARRGSRWRWLIGTGLTASIVGLIALFTLREQAESIVGLVTVPDEVGIANSLVCLTIERRRDVYC